jgi:amino acid adenylation domain-containing protein
MAPREWQMNAEPTNDTEDRLVRIWKEVLRLGEVGIHSDFFELGGDSILASQVIVRIRKELNVELRIYELFDAPTIYALARCIHSKRPLDRSPDPVRRVPRSCPLPLSHGQQRLRLLSEVEEANAAYMIPKALRIRRKLQPEKLRESLQRIVDRHEILRTKYPIQSGIPVQVIAADRHFDLPVMEIGVSAEVEIQSLIQRLVQEEVRRPIDLSCDFPLRARLVRFNENDHLLLLCIHHIAWDGWSSAVFFRELESFYAALTNGSDAVVPGLPVQYVDYAQWEQDGFRGEVSDKLIEYWKKQLAGSPSLLDLPTDYPRPAYQTFKGGLERLQLSLKLTDALRRLTRSQSATLYMTLLAAFQVLLSRYSNQTDICVGTPIGSRSRKEFENLIGLFINTLVIRCDLSGAPTFLRLLAQVRETALGAFDHHELPFEKLIQVLDPERSLSHSPLFQVMFQLRNFPESVTNLEGLDVSLVPVDPGTAQFDLYLEVSDTVQGLACVLNYNNALFDAATAKRMLGHYQRLLESIVSDPEEMIGKLGMLTEVERRKLVVEWNKTQVEFPSDECIHELFEEQVARSPEATAVVFEDVSLSYAELNSRANQLAHYLRGLGTRPGDRVVTLLERSIDLVVAELAILKCGAAYVPIDPAFPGERKQFIVTDSGAKIVLSIEGMELPVIPAVTRINLDKMMLAGSVADNPGVSLNTEAIAYIMYTSGSTGQPKGVMVPHRAIKRLALNSGYARFEPSDRVAFGSNPAFDASTMEVWAPLLNGGRIVVIGQDVLLEPARFGQTLKRHGVNILWLTVGLFNQYVDALAEELASLRYLIVGGDALDPRAISRLLCGNPPQHVINGYGPTETTTFAITHEITAVPDNARSIPIGRPIANTQVYILDGQGEPVPIGVAGEIHIGGAGVAQGYLNRPELTAERFIPDPFAGKAGARMYKTGDMGRWLEDGTVEFLGRNDRQVKIRGFRIEMEEIEARLGEHGGVREAVVVAREDEPGEKRLVAYVVLAGEPACTTAELRDHLKQKLPDYMVPAAWVVLPALPLTPNGKVDRKALPLPGADAVAELSTVYVAPDGETERKIAAIWQDVLGIAKVGRNNNFFDLGGHSLLLMRVHSQLRQAFNKDITIVDLFRYTTVRALAQHLGGQSDSSTSDRAQAQGEVRKDAMRRHRQLRRHVARELLMESHKHGPRN